MLTPAEFWSSIDELNTAFVTLHAANLVQGETIGELVTARDEAVAQVAALTAEIAELRATWTPPEPPPDEEPDPDPDPDPDPEPEVPNVARALGIFPGAFFAWDGNPNRFQRAETMLGREIPFTTLMLDQGKPEGDPRKMVASAHVLVAPDRIWRFRERVKPVVSVPLAFRIPGDLPTQADALRATIAGRWDHLFRQVATMNENAGARSVTAYPDRWARIGWEGDGKWNAWSGRDGREQLFIDAYHRIGEIFVEEGWKLMFCIMESQWTLGFGPEIWPGPVAGQVPVFNIDFYRRGWTDAAGVQRDSRRPRVQDLRAITDWAEAHGAQVSFAEWGFGTDVPGVDDPGFIDDGEWIDEIADFFESLGDQLVMQAVFSPPDRDVLAGNGPLPNVHDRWVARFGV